LSRAKGKCRIYINTHGTRGYGELIKNLLDPDGTIFEKLMICRDDVETGKKHSVFKKTAESIFPGASKLALAVDDKAHVWERNTNLLEVKEYKFWDQHLDSLPSGNDPGQVLEAVTRIASEEEKDKQLQATWMAIQRIHARVFPSVDDARRLRARKRAFDKIIQRTLRQEQVHVLRGMKIYVQFAPDNGTLTDVHGTKFQLRPCEGLEQLTKRFGAQYVERDSPDVTHIIIERFAHIDTTREFLNSRTQNKVFVVMEDWLRDSCFLWARQDEKMYQIEYLWPHPHAAKPTEKRPPKKKCTSKQKRTGLLQKRTAIAFSAAAPPPQKREKQS